MTARDIRVDPRLMEILRNCLSHMMSLMCHIIGATRLLAVRRDHGHATNEHEPSPSTTPSDHDDQGDDPFGDEGGDPSDT